MPASTTNENIHTDEPIGADAALDHAISRALLARVAAGELAGAVRIWAPVPALALSRLDLLRPGAAQAQAVARDAGVQVIRRTSGGHAVLLSPASLCVGFAEPAATFEGTQRRYERLGDAIAGALGELGIDTRQGTLDGEWCPGAWSVVAGSTKLAGLAQRAVKGGAWVEAVVELGSDPRARELLQRVYDALDIELDPSTFGSVAEAAGRDVAFGELANVLAARLIPTGVMSTASDATLEVAERWRSEYHC